MLDNKVGISTGSLKKNYNINYQLQIIKNDLKLTQCELFIQSPSEMKPTSIMNIKKYIKKNNVIINSIHPYMEGFEVPNLYSDVTIKKKDAMKLFHRYLEICHLLNVPYLVLHGPPKDMHYSECFHILNNLISEAENYGISIAIENKDYTFTGSKKNVEWLKNNLQSRNWGFVLDFKSCWKSGYSPKEIAMSMGKKLLFTHVSFRSKHTYGVSFKDEDEDIDNAMEWINNNVKNNLYIIELSEQYNKKNILTCINKLLNY